MHEKEFFMNVYDTANRLAQEIKTSKEYIEYKKAKEKVVADTNLKNKIDEFEKMRYEIQLLTMQGQKQDEEKTKKLQEMYSILVANKDIKEYFDLEVKFNVMIADVNKIIAESIKEVL